MNIFKNKKMLFDILWICLMATMCVVDIYTLHLRWSVLALIGLVFCGTSLIAKLFEVFKNN